MTSNLVFKSLIRLSRRHIINMKLTDYVYCSSYYTNVEMFEFELFAIQGHFKVKELNRYLIENGL